MFILYRYLLRQFVQIFLICFCSMDGLYIVIDAFTNLEEFISYGEKHGGVFVVMGKYYAYRSLSFFDATSGIVALIAAMFTLALFQRFNELTALLAAGIPKRRIIKPIVFAVLAISLAAAASRELADSGRPRQAGPRFARSGRRTGQGTSSQARRLDRHPACAASKPWPRRGKSSSRISCSRLRWMRRSSNSKRPTLFICPPIAEHPSGYLLKGLTQPKDLAKRPSLVQRRQADHPHAPRLPLAERRRMLRRQRHHFRATCRGRRLAAVCFVPRISGGAAEPQPGIGGRRGRGDPCPAAAAALDMTLLFLGLPLMLRRGNRNIFVAIGMCVGLVVAFLMLVMGAQYLGSSYWISPSLAAWLPLMVFVPLAMAISDPLRE